MQFVQNYSHWCRNNSPYSSDSKQLLNEQIKNIMEQSADKADTLQNIFFLLKQLQLKMPH